MLTMLKGKYALEMSTSPYAKLLMLFLIVVACIAEEPAVYLVLMEEDPVAFSNAGFLDEQGSTIQSNSGISWGYAKSLVDSHDRVLLNTLERGSYTKLHSFKYILNGFAVHTTPSQARKLKDTPGVKLVEKDRGARLMTTYTPEFLDLPNGIWTQEGGDRTAGDGVVIGFIDSGINPQHPSFAYDPANPFPSNLSHFTGACETGPKFPATSCNGKIVSARYFSAGAQAVAILNSSLDVLSPFDEDGHGSHVASTAAGNARVPVVVNGFYYGQASGMAPRARIAVYKAIYPTVGTLADVVAAIDQAILDGVDILTLSVGPDEPPEGTLTFLNIFDISLLFARRAGVFVVQAAGNKGPASSSVVSFSPWAMGVAASSTDRTYPGSLLLGNGQRISGVGLSGPTFGEDFFMHELVSAKDAIKTNGTFPTPPQYVEECQNPEALEQNIVQGRVVICTFSGGFFKGTSTLTAIIDTAKILGFTGFILVANPEYGDFIAQPIPFAVPGIMIPSSADAQVISRYYEQQTERNERGLATKFSAKVAIGEGRVASFTGRAPIVSRFSSRGPDIIDANRTLADVLKPDILAPGNQIWAAWSPMSASEPILAGHSFALLSGTSMATPHVAGIAALLKQCHPFWSPSMIASAISTTANKYDNYGELIMAESFDINSSFPSTPFEIGAGHVNPAYAIDPGLVLPSGYDDYINFLCSLPDINPAIVTATTGGLCSHPLSHPSNLNLPSLTISVLKGSISVRRSFMNVGHKPETFLCSVIPPNGTSVKLYPPWFTIQPQQIQDLEIQLYVVQPMEGFRFGEVVLTGNLNHIVRIPLSVSPVSV